MKKLALTMLAACAMSASAGDSQDWGWVATLEGGMKIHGKYGSFERYEGSGSMLVRFSKAGDVAFYVIGISDKTCDVGYGELAFFDTSWKPVKKESYVKHGGNGVALMGDLLCTVIAKSKVGGSV